MLKILSFILCIDYIFILCLSQVKKSGFHPTRKHVGFSPQVYNRNIRQDNATANLKQAKSAMKNSRTFLNFLLIKTFFSIFLLLYVIIKQQTLHFFAMQFCNVS